MALLFIDGFDHYAANDTLKKWDNFNDLMKEGDISFTSGRFSGNALTILNNQDSTRSELTKNITPSVQEVYIGFAFKYDGGSLNSDNSFFIIRDVNGDVNLWGEIEVDGTISFIRGITVDSTGTVLGNSTTALTQGAWNYIEIKYIPDNSTGVLELRINESVEFTFNGDTAASDPSFGAMGLSGHSGIFDHDFSFDDMYVLDASGTTNNTYLGDVTVYTEVPTADTTEADFSPSSGTDHFAMVDDATDIDDDSTYVENGTLGATDRYTSAALGVTGTVHGVQISTTARKTDSKTRGFKASIKSGTTQKEDTSEHLLTASYIVYRDIYEVDPNTSSAWTVSNVDSLEFGFKITTAE